MLDAVAENVDVEVPDSMVEEKVDEMLGSFERSLQAQGMEPGQYYQLAGTSAEDVKERVRPTLPTASGRSSRSMRSSPPRA